MFANELAAFELHKAAPTPPILEESSIVDAQFKLNHVLGVYYQ